MIESHRELQVWQRAIELSIENLQIDSKLSQGRTLRNYQPDQARQRLHRQQHCRRLRARIKARIQTVPMHRTRFKPGGSNAAFHSQRTSFLRCIADRKRRKINGGSRQNAEHDSEKTPGVNCGPDSLSPFPFPLYPCPFPLYPFPFPLSTPATDPPAGGPQSKSSPAPTEHE